MSILLLTEKRDQAEKLASAMGWRKGDGCYLGKFEGKPITVVWARGHLVTLKNPNEVIPNLPWDDPDALVPVPQTFPLKVNDDIPGAPAAAQPKNYVKNIKSKLSQADEFIIATDSDREGEAIGWLILDHLGYTGKVRRAWFAAGLDKKSLQDAMADLRDPSVTKSWYRASEARSRSDWAYMFLVRAYTYYAQYQFFGDLLGTGSGRERVMSVGRVQTPALSMIVTREREIAQFVSKDHYKISGIFGENTPGLKADYRPVVTREVIESQPKGVDWELPNTTPKDGEDLLEKPLYTDKSVVDDFKNRLMSAANDFVVKSYKESARSDNPPKTFSLTDAQSAIAGACKISANLAQTILEDLYEQGWTSYARTSKSDLPMNFYEPEELGSLLNAVSKLPDTAEQAKTALKIHQGNHPTYDKFVPAVFTNKQLEHHGIVPTQEVMTHASFMSIHPKKKGDNGRLEHTADHMRTAYLLVVKQFIQALYPATKYTQQTIDFSANVPDMLGHPHSEFRANGRVLIDAGWRSAFGTGTEDFVGIPSVTEGASYPLTEVNLDPSKTQPPKRYTEVTLPKAMETIGKNVSDPKLRKLLKDSEGLGTPATRKSVIDTLTARGYVEVKKGTYYPSKKGCDLIDSVPKWMASPEQTALWEDYLVKICGEKNDDRAIEMRDEFVQKQIKRVEAIIQDMNTNLKPEAANRVKNRMGPTKVTAKMKDYIKKLAERKDIKIPKGTLSDINLAQAFLDEHAPKRSADGKPSEKQVNLVRQIADNLPEGTTFDEKVLETSKACSEFIDKNREHLPKRKPSEKQIALIQKLVDELPNGEEPPKNVLEDANVARKFIDDQLSKNKSKKKGKSK